MGFSGYFREEILIAQTDGGGYNECMKYSHLLSAHRKKIIIGAPILFLVLINAGIATGGNVLKLVPEGSVFVSTGDAVPVQLMVYTKSAVNAMGGTILFSPDVLQVDAVTRQSSIIDLWSEDPLVNNTSGEIHWSGGIVNENDETSNGQVFTIQFHAAHPGKSRVRIADGQLLTKDGEGTNILSGTESVLLYVREPGQPSPDINNDGALSISDINGLYLKTFSDYNEIYDLNGDQRVSWRDVLTLISIIRLEPSDR
jgi:hypothetical protein